MKLPANFAPYASPANIVSVILRFRTMELPATITTAHLAASGVAKGNFSRVQQALLFLGLITEDHEPTPKFSELANAPENELANVLRLVVDEAYSPLLQVVNPELDSSDSIRQQFQQYSPKSQTQQMTVLFLALCVEAGYRVKDPPRKRTTRSAPPSAKRTSSGTTSQRPLQPADNAEAVASEDAGAAASPPSAGDSQAVPRTDPRFHKLIAGMLDVLPPIGDTRADWDAAAIEDWLADFGVVLRRAYGVRANKTQT